MCYNFKYFYQCGCEIKQGPVTKECMLTCGKVTFMDMLLDGYCADHLYLKILDTTEARKERYAQYNRKKNMIEEMLKESGKYPPDFEVDPSRKVPKDKGPRLIDF